ncbi:unnamed protein product [Onchocerca ochengi]|uniref:Uncharacterized protein n=1 Tax=Onchocerca ochengi TaxID=42157 RepID=A0A182E6N3_ONCOC|nr:unnamed protein product [Onchocerca ochengi]
MQVKKQKTVKKMDKEEGYFLRSKVQVSELSEGTEKERRAGTEVDDRLQQQQQQQQQQRHDMLTKMLE